MFKMFHTFASPFKTYLPFGDGGQKTIAKTNSNSLILFKPFTSVPQTITTLLWLFVVGGCVDSSKTNAILERQVQKMDELEKTIQTQGNQMAEPINNMSERFNELSQNYEKTFATIAENIGTLTHSTTQLLAKITPEKMDQITQQIEKLATASETLNTFMKDNKETIQTMMTGLKDPKDPKKNIFASLNSISEDFDSFNKMIKNLPDDLDKKFKIGDFKTSLDNLSLPLKNLNDNISNHIEVIKAHCYAMSRASRFAYILSKDEYDLLLSICPKPEKKKN